MPLLTAQDAIVASLKQHQLVPDLWSGEETISSSTMLQVEYPEDLQVSFGNTLLKSQTQSCPTVQFVPPEEDAQYTLMMIDPDAPSRSNGEFGPWRHWVVVNIKAGDVASGDAHTPYIGPGPGPNSGNHRYTFLLFKQGKLNHVFAPMAHQEKPDRRRFAFKDFAAENDLELVAVNFFVCPADQ